MQYHARLESLAGTNKELMGIAYGANTFVAIGNTALLTSPDGAAWHPELWDQLITGRYNYGNEMGNSRR